MEKRSEFEIVQHTNMSLLEIFLVEISSRSPHGHEDLEIGILLKGSMALFTDQRRRALHPGDIYIINRCQVHSFLNVGQENLLLAFQVHRDLYRKIHPKLDYLKVEENIIRGGALYDSVRSGLILCANAFFSQDEYREIKCASIILDVLHQLLTSSRCTISSEQATAAAQNNILRLNRMTAFISEHYAERVSLEDIAAKEHISPYHASHFFTGMVGISLQEYINLTRFEHALRLMDSTNLSLLDVCMESGFSSTRYLNRMFEKMLGCTAREYRLADKKPAPIVMSIPAGNVERRLPFNRSGELLREYFE